MARFYAHYTNATVSALEATSGNNYYQRRAMNTTNAATARTAMINARATLSTAFYADIASASNRNGNLGIVVPADGYTNNGTTVSGANIYTETTPAPGAVWQSDPRIRPTSQILVAGTESTIVDAWDVATTDYNACLTARGDYMTAITGGSPYTRLGNNPWRTLASIWHDHNMDYFAWDDYTPGQPSSIAVNVSTSLVIITGLNNYEFTADRLADIEVTAVGTINGQNVSLSDNAIAPLSSQAQLSHGVSASNGQPWSLTVTARYKYTASTAQLSNPFLSYGATTSLSTSGTVGGV